jgi:hypothetical protein
MESVHYRTSQVQHGADEAETAQVGSNLYGRLVAMQGKSNDLALRDLADCIFTYILRPWLLSSPRDH